MPDSTHDGDRRVRRTREALRQALLTLLAERGWDGVSVQDLCDRADIGRSTFYMHYQSKEAMLEEGLNDLRLFVRDVGAASGQRAEPFAFLRGLIDHVLEQQRVFRAMIGSHGGHVVRIRFRDMLHQLVSEDSALDGISGWRRDVTARLLAGALLELLTWLAEARRTVSADEIEQYVRATAIAVLAAEGTT